MKLDTLEIGKDAVVASVTSDDQALRQHILDMGLTPGTEVTMMKYAPMGDPLEIRLRGYELTLRKDDAARIELVDVHDTDTGPRANAAIGTTEHPALGEGTYSPRAAKTAVPEGAPLHFALAGNQNCGKTTLFNQLTGSNQHVGNFPGVTVDRKDGTIRNHPEASVTDLPGIYSLSPYTGEEVVSRQFILDERPDAIIDIIDQEGWLDHTIFISFDLQNMICIRERLPEQKAQFLISDYPDWLVDTLKLHRLDLDIKYTALTKERVEELHAAGIEVNVWTVDTLEDAQRMVEYGVDYITSNIVE